MSYNAIAEIYVLSDKRSLLRSRTNPPSELRKHEGDRSAETTAVARAQRHLRHRTRVDTFGHDLHYSKWGTREGNPSSRPKPAAWYPGKLGFARLGFWHGKLKALKWRGDYQKNQVVTSSCHVLWDA